MAKKEDSSSQPPSLFDNLEMFAPAVPAGGGEDSGRNGKPEKSEKELPPAPPDTAAKGLTGSGPMRELFDFNFRTLPCEQRRL